MDRLAVLFCTLLGFRRKLESVSNRCLGQDVLRVCGINLDPPAQLFDDDTEIICLFATAWAPEDISSPRRQSSRARRIFQYHAPYDCPSFRKKVPFSYQVPSLRPYHQINPTVAVFCWLLSTPYVEVRNDGWFEKSRRHS